MKRTEMKRGKPLARGKGLSRGSKEMKRTELKQGDSKLARSGGPARRSKARTKQMSEDRAPLVQALVEAGVTCEISMVLEELGIPHQCQRNLSGMHERRKSGAGGSRVNRENLIPACSWCNGYIEDVFDAPGKPYRTLIEGSYLVIREGHDDWERMGKRNDRLDTEDTV